MSVSTRGGCSVSRAARASRAGKFGSFLFVAAFLVIGPGLAEGAKAKRFSASDVRNVRAALAAIAVGDAKASRAYSRDLRDPLAIKIITWFAVTRRDPVASFATVTGFLRYNPTWPWRSRVRRNIERSLATTTLAANILRHYATSAPRSREAQDRAVAVLRVAKKDAEARDLIRRAWVGTLFDKEDETDFYTLYGADLRPEDHVARLRSLLRRADRPGAKAARRLIKLAALPEAETLAAETRLMMRGRRTRRLNATILANLRRLPRAIKSHPDLQFDKMVWYRKTRRMDKAIAILNATPALPASPKRWWETREKAGRKALRAGDYKLAYDLARSHRQHTTAYYGRAEWTAGWIALRFLKKPDVARQHFAVANAMAKNWAERAQALYWSGRTVEALGQEHEAKHYYNEGAKNPATFYGQLASSRTGGGKIVFPDTAAKDPSDRAFDHHELVRVTRLLLRLGRVKAASAFARASIGHVAKTPRQHRILVEIVSRATAPEKRAHAEIRLARFAQHRGSSVVEMGYPMIDLPKENTVEKALVFALIRQESEFKAKAKSWAGARGLMQLMTFTARTEAKDLRLPYSTRRLTADPAYNLRLGTHHLARLMERFDGSYPLVLAAYNAGPHRVDSWLARHGDPRKTKNIDMVDWIEMIPFEETRNYVKVVLGNYAVYRTQLGEDVEAETLIEQWAEPTELKEARAAICRGDAPAKDGTLAVAAGKARIARRLNKVNPASGVNVVRPAHAGVPATAKVINLPAVAVAKDATAVFLAESVCTQND